MWTVIVDAVLAALVMLALIMRPGKITTVVTVAFLGAAALGPFLAGVSQEAFLALVDYIVVFSMLVIWTKHDDMRAYAIGALGLAKILFAFAFSPTVGFLHAGNWVFAAALNCAFAAQVAVAGGILDGVGHRLDDLLRAIAPRRYRLLRNGAD